LVGNTPTGLTVAVSLADLLEASAPGNARFRIRSGLPIREGEWNVHSFLSDGAIDVSECVR